MTIYRFDIEETHVDKASRLVSMTVRERPYAWVADLFLTLRALEAYVSKDKQVQQATAKMIARQTMHAMIGEGVRADFSFEDIIQGAMEGVREWVMQHAQEDFDGTAGVLQRASKTLLRMPEVG